MSMRIQENQSENLLRETYAMEGENNYEDITNRICQPKYFDSPEQRERVKNYMLKKWFIPSSPVMMNLGTHTKTKDGIDRAFPISCFLLEMEDNMESIIEKISQSGMLAYNSGGIAVSCGGLRTIGQLIGNNRGQTSGQLAFGYPINDLTSIICQGNKRKGASAVYFRIDSAEIFMILKARDMVKQSSHKYDHSKIGIILTKEFMEKLILAFKTNTKQKINLITPTEVNGVKTNKVVDEADVVTLFDELIKARSGVGDYYIMFEDNVNEALKPWQKELGLNVTMSNLCTEILLPTSVDYSGKKRDAICCLLQLNIEKYDEWGEDEYFLYDVLAFADTILDVFIENIKLRGVEEYYKNCIYSIEQERSVGIGMMGVHSYFQKNRELIDSEEGWKKYEDIWKNINSGLNTATIKLGEERGNCNDYQKWLEGKYGYGACAYSLNDWNYLETRYRRNSNITAVAPTAKSSQIADVSPMGEPYTSNVYSQKSSMGTEIIVNPELKKLLIEKGQYTPEILSRIISDEGSVKNLEFLSDHEKAVFRTYHEYPNMRKLLIDQTAMVQKYVDQGISLNLEYTKDEDSGLTNLNKMAKDIIYAYKKGIKTLYYTQTPKLTETVKSSDLGGDILKKFKDNMNKEISKNDEGCISCQ